MILTTPEQISTYRLAVLRSTLKLEIAGMKGRGRTALSVLRGMGYSGNREKVLAQVSADVETKIEALK
jgi:succinylarginine dihydrolase